MQNGARLLVGARFVRPGQPDAVGLRVDGRGRIAQVVASHAGLRLAAAGAQRVELGGGGTTVLPGLVDAHNHPALMSRRQAGVDLWEASGTTAVRELLEPAVRRTPFEEWVVAHGMRDVATRLSRTDLEAMFPGRRILVVDASYHAARVSAAGRDALPEGLPAGEDDTLLEGNGLRQALAATCPPPPRLACIMRRFLDRLLSLGVCTVHDLYVSAPAELEAYRLLAAGRGLDPAVRLYLAPELREAWPGALPFLPESCRADGVKVFVDGSLGARSAALRTPWADGGGPAPLPDPGVLSGALEAATAWGLEAVALHALGDAAVAWAADAIERVSAGDLRLRFRVEHLELAEDRDLRRLAAAGAVACLQPCFLSDAVTYADRLGPRTAELCPHRRVLAAGLPLALGSDDMPSGPLLGIAAAEGADDAGARLTFEEALDSHTRGAARAAGDQDRGVLEPGARADLVVVPEDPRRLDPAALARLPVRETWIGGRPRWRAHSWR